MRLSEYKYKLAFTLAIINLHMDPGGKIYTIDEFRCWKVENLDDEGSDENKNEKEGYRVDSPHLIAYMLF
jgi:hypothetical protein